jgi:hypothetical protein
MQGKKLYMEQLFKSFQLSQWAGVFSYLKIIMVFHNENGGLPALNAYFWEAQK